MTIFSANSRIPTLTGLLTAGLVALALAGCAGYGGGAGEPIALPSLPEAAPLAPEPTLAPATPLPQPTEPPMAAALLPATQLPAATALPPATQLPIAGIAPTAPLAPAAPVLPTSGPAPTATPEPDTPATAPAFPLVTIGDAVWRVELALDPDQRRQGLSGREELPSGAGMLFVYEQEQPLSFWMPDMNFPLDMVWISAGCRVADVTLNAPIPLPGQSRDDLPHFSPREPAQYVLEINAGEYEAAGIDTGDPVAFAGAIAGQFGC